MFACLSCAFGSPQGLISVSAILGGWSAYVAFRPVALLERMPRCWGIPQFGVADFVSLFLMLTWPSMLARIGREHDIGYLAVCFGLFAACVVYLWLRGLWILQQMQVKSFVRRTLFLSILVPGAIVFSLLVGALTIVAILLPPILFHAVPMGSDDVVYVFGFVAVLTAITGFVYWLLQLGLDFVFGKPPDRTGKQPGVAAPDNASARKDLLIDNSAWPVA
jgi:hypothetical protein